MLLTFLLVTVGWIFFRAESVGGAWTWIRAICSRSLFTLPVIYSLRSIVPAVASIPALLVLEWFRRGEEHALKPIAGRKALTTLLYLAVFISVFVAAVSQQGNPAFIYFQF